MKDFRKVLESMKYGEDSESNEETPIKEKYLKSSEVTKLINHTENAVKKLLKDPKKSSEVKSDAREVLSWISGVRDTWKTEKKLHPNVILKLMKTSAGIGSGRYGYSKKGFKKSPDGKVPPNFSK